MALDFPANPTDGQVYGSYTYSSSKGVWQGTPLSATVAIVSPTVPASSKNGDIWFNSTSGICYVYVNDGTSSQWVEIVSSAIPLLSSKADLTYTNTQLGLKANIAGQIFTGAIASNSSVTGTTPVNGGSAGGIVVKTPPSGTQTSAYIQFTNNDSTTQYGSISASTGSVITIDGKLSVPNQPVYSGTLQYASGNVTNFYPVTYDTFITGFSKSGNNRLTATVAGKYYVAAQQLINGGSYLCIYKNGSEIAHAYSNADDTYDMNISALLDLQVNDYVELYYHGGTGLSYAWGDAHSRYSVFKVS